MEGPQSKANLAAAAGELAMLTVCALILASLCIPQDYVPVTKLEGQVVQIHPTFDPAVSRRRGIEIDAIEGDNGNIAGSLFLDRACADGLCVYYERHCDNARRFCRFDISPPAKDNARGSTIFFDAIEIRARDRALMARTIAALDVALRDGTTMDLLPLAALDHETHGSRGRCSRVVWFEGCDRPTMPGLPRPAQL